MRKQFSLMVLVVVILIVNNVYFSFAQIPPNNPPLLAVDKIHPSNGQYLVEVVARELGFEIRQITGDFISESDLEDVEILFVDYSYYPYLLEEIELVKRFVANGGGLYTALPQEEQNLLWEEFGFNLTGDYHYIQNTHIQDIAFTHPIMDNVTELELLNDVLALSSLVSPATCILRREGIPILLTSNYGKGRVFMDLCYGIGYNDLHDNLRVVRNVLVWLKGTTCDVFSVHDGYVYHVNVLTNSMISMFQFDEGSMKIGFNVTGLLGMDQFVNITIPIELLNGDFTVRVDDSFVDPVLVQNSTHSQLGLTYAHRAHHIEITGTTAIPEFPSYLILPLFMLATLLSIVYGIRVPSTSHKKLR